MSERIDIRRVCREAEGLDDPETIEPVIHAALIKAGVPMRCVALLKAPLDFDGPADYLTHIRDTLAPEFEVVYE